MSETPEPTPEAAPPQADAAAPAAAATQARPPWLPILIGVGAAVLLIAALLVWGPRMFGGDPNAYTIETYAPTTELISARERVPGYEAPDAASPVAVQFGAGVTLHVTGRVARGIGNDWYAVAWNERTVFVRQADVVEGSGAPPAPVVREEEPEPEVVEDKPEDKLPTQDEIVDAFPEPAPTYGLEISDVSWIREPTSRDFARYFPRRALDQGQSGRVVLDCLIGDNGRLSCSVAQESPSGYGFGQAGMNISRQLRVQSRLPNGSPAAGRRLRLPLSFQAG